MYIYLLLLRKYPAYLSSPASPEAPALIKIKSKRIRSLSPRMSRSGLDAGRYRIPVSNFGGTGAG